MRDRARITGRPRKPRKPDDTLRAVLRRWLPGSRPSPDTTFLDSQRHHQKRNESGPISGSVCSNPLSRLLTRDNMGPLVLVEAGRSQFGLSAKDLTAGKGSGTAPASTEDEVWSQDNVWSSKTSQQFLASHAKAATRAVIESWPESFRGVSSLVDVGGRGGTAVGMLVKAFPWIRGMNFDLPHVVSEAPLLDGVEHVGGNMFENIPQAHAVMLMWILHDWSDELCIEILKKCKEAVPKDGGKVIIVEAVIDEEEEGGGRDEYTGARLAIVGSPAFSSLRLDRTEYGLRPPARRNTYRCIKDCTNT
ncbi:hypothetical protein ACS0TY_025860 [Phlomoides rotata]